MIIFNLHHLKNKLDRKYGREVTKEELAKGMGVNRHTVAKMLTGPKSVTFRVMKKALVYFRSEGFDVTTDDLLIWEGELPPLGVSDNQST